MVSFLVAYRLPMYHAVLICARLAPNGLVGSISTLWQRGGGAALPPAPPFAQTPARRSLSRALLRQPYLDRHRGVHRPGTGLNGCVVSQKRRQKAIDFLVS